MTTLPPCTSCNKCCYLKDDPFYEVELFEADIKRIPLELQETKEVNNVTSIYMRRLPNGACIALDIETGKCTIYANRPYECKEFFPRGGKKCLKLQEGK